MNAVSRLSGLVWLGLAAGGAMVVGSFGPWAKAIGLLNLSLSGTDGSNDGWFVVAAAVVGGVTLVLYHERERFWAVGTALAGAVGTAVTVYDRGNVTDAADENTSTLVSFQVGWGLNLALGASVVLGIVGLVALLGNQGSPGMKTARARAPQSGQDTYRTCPNCGGSVNRAAGACPRCGAESKPWIPHAGVWWVQSSTGAWQWLDARSNVWRWYRDGTPSSPSGADRTPSLDIDPAQVSPPGTSPQTWPPDKSDEPLAPRSPAPSAELERLGDLHARGILTDDEFQQAKRRVLDS